MSRLTRAVESKRAVIEAHQRDLRDGVARFNEGLGERAAQPSWLGAAFGAGLLGGLGFGRRRRPAPEPTGSTGGTWLTSLIREFGVPFAMNLLRQYMAQRHPPEEPPAEPPTGEPTPREQE
ncbi:hypothetical protein H0Z60_19840 [Ectothiorhodospiraceae bacterium WFHF3C12]|nr:hypothetical protein [Ectothiorhodospiraceae bacterium WFHF3C12]